MATLKMVPDLLDRSAYVKKINRCWNILPVANVQPNFVKTKSTVCRQLRILHKTVLNKSGGQTMINKSICFIKNNKQKLKWKQQRLKIYNTQSYIMKLFNEICCEGNNYSCHQGVNSLIPVNSFKYQVMRYHLMYIGKTTLVIIYHHK